MGKFIGKRFNLSPNSYLGFAIISFVLAFICHAKGQEALLKLFANCQFVDRSTIIWSGIGLCGIFLLLILFVEGRRKPTLSATDKEAMATLKRVTGEWLTGKDIISICSIPHSSLLQYIIKGLPAYRSSTDISFPKSKQIRIPDAEIAFMLGNDDRLNSDAIEKLENFWFYTADVKKYIK